MKNKLTYLIITFVSVVTSFSSYSMDYTPVSEKFNPYGEISEDQFFSEMKDYADRIPNQDESNEKLTHNVNFQQNKVASKRDWEDHREKCKQKQKSFPLFDDFQDSHQENIYSFHEEIENRNINNSPTEHKFFTPVESSINEFSNDYPTYPQTRKVITVFECNLEAKIKELLEHENSKYENILGDFTYEDLCKIYYFVIE